LSTQATCPRLLNPNYDPDYLKYIVDRDAYQQHDEVSEDSDADVPDDELLKQYVYMCDASK
jgi:hypothetical protein